MFYLSTFNQSVFENPDPRASFDWDFTKRQRPSFLNFTRASSASYFDEQGILRTGGNNYLRFDYDPDTKQCKGILVEGSRTNLILNSLDLTASGWGNTGTSSTRISVLQDNPMGTASVTKFIVNETASSSKILIQNASSITSGVNYTTTIVAKAAELEWIQILFGTSGFGTAPWANFNLTTGVIGNVGTGVTAQIVSLGNGWYRCSATATATSDSATNAYAIALLAIDSTVRTPAFTGNIGDGVFVTGAQMEVGSFASSHIVTTNTTLTRVADSCVITALASIGYNASAGTFLAEYQVTQTSNTHQRLLEVNGGGTANRIGVTAVLNGNNRVFANIDNVQPVGFDVGAVTANTPMRLAVAYALDDYAGSSNGGAVATDPSGGVPVVTQMVLGDSTGNANRELFGHIRRLVYYPRRLSNEQLQALTS